MRPRVGETLRMDPADSSEKGSTTRSSRLSSIESSQSVLFASRKSSMAGCFTLHLALQTILFTAQWLIGNGWETSKWEPITGHEELVLLA